MSIIPLTKLQKEIMQEFYLVPATKVIYNKSERQNLWKLATARSNSLNFDELKNKCPALEHQIQKSYQSGKNIQSAVFSECVYAQTFANMMNLDIFVNCYEKENFIPEPVIRLLASYHLVPRYVYSTSDKRRMLIQAGGCDGIDSALITVIDLVIYTIEFKEPGAKTSEPDLPKYKEDGILVVTEKWIQNNPQFKAMLAEQEGLNFFEVMGSNINNFSKESIDIAVSNNYSAAKKYADVICTEDTKGFLVMIPTNQASVWADIEGEIRPAGRNHYNVWTPNALKKFIIQKGGTINGDIVTINKSNLDERRERGGNRKLSGYKVTPLFFVYVNDCVEQNGILTFDIKKMQQLNPTIAGKMFFKKLSHKDVKSYYGL
ncbi:MAG: hypothetical protein PUA56_00955 [Bacillales bacterium]|nr:hypothetical protein [Bacillales bacterium]